jgi:predicted GNAT family N-acyltransferase
MPEEPRIEVEVTDWAASGPELRAVRQAVFIDEQGIPPADEWDPLDAGSTHVLVRLKRDPVGTGRLEATGKIGRLAVLKAARRLGIGSRVLTKLIEIARRRGLDGVYLNAQLTALDFYDVHGFVAEGAEFDEAGIRHRRMRLAFSAEQRPDPTPDGGPHGAVDG